MNLLIIGRMKKTMAEVIRKDYGINDDHYDPIPVFTQSGDDRYINVDKMIIKEADVFSNEGSYYVRIHEKGKAKGVLTEITISENTFNLLNKYMEVKKVPSVYLFSSTKASADGMAKNLSREVFNRYVRNLAKYVDVKHNTKIYKTVENNSSHFLRHSKATYLLNVKKEDVVTVKEILRHKSIDSTLIYLNPEEEAINKVRINNDL